MLGDNKTSLTNRNLDKLKEEIGMTPTMKAFLDVSPLAMNIWDTNMVNIMCNKQVLDIFNIKDETEYLENFFKFSPQYQPNGKTSKEMASINFQIAINEGKNVFSWMHQNLQGEDIQAEITLERVDSEGGRAFLVGFIKDLRSDFMQSTDEKYDYYFADKIPHRILLSEMSSLTNEWFCSMDLRTGNIHYYGDIWFESFGCDSFVNTDQILKNKFVHEDDIEVFIELISNLKKGVSKSYDIRFLTNTAEYCYYRVACKSICDKEGVPVFAIGRGTDIREEKMYEERSQKDLLTQCYNKVSAEMIIESKLKKQCDREHAFFMVDIDNFKGINDNLGHFFGDEVLKEVATGLKATFREADIIARVGGDEFVVFIENILDVELINKKAQKILNIYKKSYSGEYKNYEISGSVGIALYPAHGTTYDELYQNADKALNQAKLLGKNRYVSYSDTLNIGTTRNITKIENANRIAGSFFDYDLISAVFNILYEKIGDRKSINLALKYLCKKYNADRSYIFESVNGGETYDNTFECTKEGISPQIDKLQGLEKSMFADLIEKSHDNIIYSNNVRETVENDMAFNTMKELGILSFVHAQIKRDGIMTFFIGLDDCTKERVWSEREINSLQYIGKMMSIILQGNHLNTRVKRLVTKNENSAHILDSSENVVYVSDLDTYDILYLNKKTLDSIGNPSESERRSKKCYELLHKKSHPCEFCKIDKLSQDKYYEWSYYDDNINRMFLIKEKLIPFNGKLATLTIATDISKLAELEEKLQAQLEDEHFITGCVEMLHSGKDPNTSIYKLLKAVAKYYDAQRSYIFEISDCGKYISNTYEFCGEGIVPFKDILQDLPLGELDLLVKNCRELGSFKLQLDELDEVENPREYELMKRQNLTSILTSAISVDDGQITGFVGVDNPKKNLEKTCTIRSVAKFIANFLDETELVTKLNKLSYYDTLTGVKNRHSYNSVLKKINGSADIQSLGVSYIDIVGLSSINETKGIAFGDNCLKRLAQISSEIFNADVFRVGGDEFVILKENIQESEFEKNIDDLKNELLKEKDFKVSVGYTWNKNFSYCAEGISDGKRYSRILSENLDMEIRNNKFVVYLQPQINLVTSKIVSAEALVRRVGAKNSLQPPTAFIPFYEKEGMISKIDTFVFKTVCSLLKKWEDEGASQIEAISVNCSRMTIAEEGIVEKFSAICDQFGVARSKIVIEITETINGIGEKVLARIIKNFSDAGFLVSLDDFGSGYSNLSSLVNSDFDEIKIDMQLVSDIHKNEKSKILTELSIALCNKLNNLVSVAEGIEIEEQLEVLKELNCAKGQGYYIDKPMPIGEFLSKCC